MTKQTKTALQGYFNTGDVPTEAQFADLIDTALRGAASLVVAASDAPQSWIDRADYACDGTSDEVQIQAALDALGAVGGRVVLSEGTFTCGRAGVWGATPATGYSVYLNAAHGPVIIEGQGWATEIKQADSTPADTSLIYLRGENGANRTNKTEIRNLKINGNKTGQSVTWTDFAALEIAYCENVTVEGVYFTDPNWCSLRSFLRAKNITMRGCYFDCTNLKVGLRTENPNVAISGCYFLGGATGTMLDISCNADIAVPSEMLSIQNNTFDAGSAQVVVSGGRRCLFVGNTFMNVTNASGYCIQLNGYNHATNDYQAIENLITSNVFYNVRQGVRLAGNADANLGVLRNTIALNMFIDGPDVSFANGVIESGSNVDYNKIFDNTFQGVATPTTVVGSNSVVR